MVSPETSYRDFRLLFDTLAEDVVRAIGNSKKSLSQPKRRALVRTIFALVEAGTWSRKQIALLQHELGNVSFSEGEIALLKEEQYDLDQSGAVKVQKKFLRLADNIKFGVKAYAKAAGIRYVLPTDNNDWQAFLNSIKVRNRITHPKKSTELIITDEELRELIQAFKFTLDNSKNIQRLLDEKLGK